MKVAILTDGIFPFVVGGMQKHSYNLIKHFAKSGVELTLFHCVFNQNLPTEKVVNRLIFGDNKRYYIKVKGYQFPSSLRFPGHYFYNSKKYSKFIYNDLINEIVDYDFIYAKGFTAWKLLEEKKKGDRIPKIGINFHGYEMWQYAPSLKSKLKQYMFRPFVKWNNLNADFVFSYGGKVTEIIKSIGIENNKIIEIPSGVDEDWIRESTIIVNKNVKFLFLGRYERRKGIEELNIVINQIKKEDIKSEFHFIGPIPENKRLDVTDKLVNYHGEIKETKTIKKIMDSCDVILCPSYSEGMPNVILEGMARGLAVIATDVGAINLLVDHKNGHLIKFKNRNNLIEDLFSSIKRMSSLNKSELFNKRQTSLLRISSFSLDKIAGKHVESMMNIIQK